MELKSIIARDRSFAARKSSLVRRGRRSTSAIPTPARERERERERERARESEREREREREGISLRPHLSPTAHSLVFAILFIMQSRAAVQINRYSLPDRRHGLFPPTTWHSDEIDQRGSLATFIAQCFRSVCYFSLKSAPLFLRMIGEGDESRA